MYCDGDLHLISVSNFCIGKTFNCLLHLPSDFLVDCTVFVKTFKALFFRFVFRLFSTKYYVYHKYINEDFKYNIPNSKDRFYKNMKKLVVKIPIHIQLYRFNDIFYLTHLTDVDFL